MEEEEDFPYQCKKCPDKFKITADLQKHIRETHRQRQRTSSVSSGNSERSQNDDRILCDTSPIQDSPTDDVDTSPESSWGRQLICRSCKHIFDTKDSIVSHLIRLSRTEDGDLKCPFCVKVRIQSYKFPNPIKIRAKSRSPEPECGPTFMRIPPGPPPRENLTTRRMSRLFQNRRKVLKPMQLERSQSQVGKREVVMQRRGPGRPRKFILKKPAHRRLSEVQLQLSLEHCFRQV